MKKFGIVMGCVFAISGAASADVQKCVMRTGQGIQKGWIAPEIYIAYDEASKKVQVIDGIVAEANNKKPIDARIGEEKAGSRSIDWSLFLVSNTGQRTKMTYQATLLFAANELHVTARPTGYRDFFTAVGTCAPYNG